MVEPFDFKKLLSDEMMEDDTEFIPLITNEEEEGDFVSENNLEMPVLTLKNTVLFPGVVIPITVGRDKSIKLINKAYKGNKTIAVVSQKDDKIEDPGFDDIFKIGTIGFILKVLRMPDGNTTVIIQGKRRCEIKEIVSQSPYLIGKVDHLPENRPKKNKNYNALISSIKDLALKIIKESPNIPSEASFAIKNIESQAFLINFIGSNLNIETNDKQLLLEEGLIEERALKVLGHLTKELQMLELKNQIQSKVKTDIDNQQREYFLNQQLKTIQEELGNGGHVQEIINLKNRAAEKKWSEATAKHFTKELQKLERLNPQAAEFSVYMNYLELLLDLPWNEYTEDIFDLAKAKKILDRDHFGLDDVKERILEHLAVLKLKNNMKSPILCLYGPPGVGKTSLGKSIAEAIGRKYVRMSLGGVRDEAEIRGHRKTYIGAMPGRIIQNLKKAQSANPVFVLDEIDKINRDTHGDPSSALLETLDPEQNSTFYDNYVEHDFDLSKVFFIATCNELSTIQPALRDRMEIIEVTGYTLEEKVEIAKQHLIPKLLEEHGLKKSDFKIGKKELEFIVDGYTRESGVRGLNQLIAKLVRNQAKILVMEGKNQPKISQDIVIKVLGAPRNSDKYQGNDYAGVVTGLAWTAVGGDILFIEVSLSKGKGKLTTTGNLGNVMKESTQLALEYLKVHADEYGIDASVFENADIHVHVPQGAVPKDGPSAGITMLTALASAFTQKKVVERLAMTGEITLRGKVLPVGGIKEKILAAKRANIQTIILSEDNRNDIEKIGAEYIKGLNFKYVNDAKEVLKLALTNELVSHPKFIKNAN
jgi:ATP-dependent Lon protease